MTRIEPQPEPEILTLLRVGRNVLTEATAYTALTQAQPECDDEGDPLDPRAWLTWDEARMTQRHTFQTAIAAWERVAGPVEINGVPTHHVMSVVWVVEERLGIKA